MKTFKDLSFNLMELPDKKNSNFVSKMFFPNGYGISVILGRDFWSNGVDRYEVKIIYQEQADGKFIKEDHFAYANENEVNKIMEKLQKL
jgi:hypothetical protein